MKLTTLKSMNHKFAYASGTFITVCVLGAAALEMSTAFAADSQDQVSSGKVIINAKGAAPSFDGTGDSSNGQTNNATTQTPSTDGQTNQGSTTNNGTSQTVTGAKMDNVTFSATQITPTGSASAMNPADPATYTPTANITNQTTNADGIATFNLTGNGYYLIHQITLVGGVQEIKDFIIQVNSNDSKAGDLNVYPKLDLSSTDRSGNVQSSANAAADTSVVKGAADMIGNPNTVTGAAPHAGSDNVTDTNMTDGGNTNTAGSGDTITLNLNTTFDISQITNNDNFSGTTPSYLTNDTINGKLVGSYIIKDELPTGLALAVGDAGSYGIKITDAAGTVLTYGTDYTVTVSGQNVSIALTVAGQEKVYADLGESSNATIALNVQIPTMVSDSAQGQLTDTPTTTVTNAYGVLLSNTTLENTTVDVGSTQITKVDRSGTPITTGATFVLVQATSSDAAKALVEENTGYFNNSSAADTAEHMTYTNETDKAAFVTNNAGKIVQTTTDSNGVGNFTSINLWSKTDTAAATDFTSASDYYAVEVVAPNGYQLPDASKGDNVFSVTANVTPTNTNIENLKPFALPFTGGEGLAGIVIIASVSGLAAFAIRRKKVVEEEA